MYLIVFIFLSFLLIVEYLFYITLKSAFLYTEWLFPIYFVVSAFVSIIMIFLTYGIIFPKEKSRWKPILYFTSTFMLFFLPKIFVSFLFIIERSIYFVKSIIFSSTSSTLLQNPLIAKVILFLGFLFFLILIHGTLIGRHKYRVITKTLFFDHLPTSFDGFKLLQISDIHSGSLFNKDKIFKGIDLINAQQVDLIVFTGDIINSHVNEMENWIEVFAQIKKAPLGNFSILGNHDYGSHNGQVSAAKKELAINQLKDLHQKIGFDLLLNENRILEIDNHKINLLGVENFGAPPFAQHGDLTKTSADIHPNDFNILLSHDPSHFDIEIKHFDKHIPLTLSGHTHGMQFGFEIFGLKWSPVKYKYKKWAGIYKENNRYLYVNRGFGYIGIPARIGIWPEITVIQLKKTV